MNLNSNSGGSFVSVLCDLLDRRVRVAECTVTPDLVHTILPEEANAVAKAVVKRRAEFAAGRLCARQAMAALGLPSKPLLKGPDRVPCWPEGVVGSITHTNTHAAAAVARRLDGIVAVGIDLEPLGDLNTELWQIVLRPAERTWLESCAKGERGALAKAYFSAKEAAYKAQYTLSKTFMEFEDFEVALDNARENFTARFTRDVPPFRAGQTLRGGLCMNADLIATAVVLDRDVGSD